MSGRVTIEIVRNPKGYGGRPYEVWWTDASRSGGRLAYATIGEARREAKARAAKTGGRIVENLRAATPTHWHAAMGRPAPASRGDLKSAGAKLKPEAPTAAKAKDARPSFMRGDGDARRCELVGTPTKRKTAPPLTRDELLDWSRAPAGSMRASLFSMGRKEGWIVFDAGGWRDSST